MIPITFGKSSLNFVLQLLDKSVDVDGYLVENQNKNQRVITPDGEYVKSDEIGVVRPGSQIFIKKDIGSLVKYASDLI